MNILKTSTRVNTDEQKYLANRRKIFKLATILLTFAVFSSVAIGQPVIQAATLTAPVVKITAPAKVTGGQAGYAAYVTVEKGNTCKWTVDNGVIMVGDISDTISFTPGKSGFVTLTCKVTNPSSESATSTAKISITSAKIPPFNIDQAVSDRAQSTTIAFAGFGMITGNLGAQTFFPPGKVADYWGFQYLRDNDPDKMGHNTSFLTKVACNMLFILNDSQLAQMKVLAKNQVAKINLYAWKRYPLMMAFRRMMDGKMPSNAKGLSLDAVKAASKELYILDGQISYERAVVYADIIRSLTSDQKTYIGAMVGKGFKSWPDKDESVMRPKTQGLSHDEVVAMMTYASDFYSWFAGSITSDVYFCPERHGTYFGSFYIKDAPAVGHAGYGIDETLTATVGNALCDSREGFISSAGAKKMNDLVEIQRKNLYKNSSSNIVQVRTKISEVLRKLITSVKPSADDLSKIKSDVDKYSGIYGELDGENIYNYTTTFYQLFRNIGGSYITDSQKKSLSTLRKKYMTVTYPDGKTEDFSYCTKYFIYATEVSPTSKEFISYTNDTITNKLFNIP